MPYKFGRKRPLMLDLFCGEGGAAIGYRSAGFDIIGIDKYKMKRYPFDFHQADIKTLKWDLNRFDAIHASPPCKAHTPMRALWTHEHEPMIELTRSLLANFDGVWVIENVVGSWLLNSVTVCGASLGRAIHRPQKLFIRRHRLFSSNIPLVVPPCNCAIYRRNGYKCVPIVGNGPSFAGVDTVAIRRRLMGLPHASAAEIAQAIPPSYTKLIGDQMMAALRDWPANRIW